MMSNDHAMAVIAGVVCFTTGLCGHSTCAPKVRAADPEPSYNAVHLKKGQPAPYDGDLVDPDDLIDLLLQADCLDEYLKISTCEKTVLAKEEEHRKLLDASEAARLACENKPPVIVHVEKPVPFYERPWFTITLGVIVGGAAVWATTAALQ
jgi:hypothetical protein